MSSLEDEVATPPPFALHHGVRGLMVFFHPVWTYIRPHTHSIVEDWTVEQKNAMANHIDKYHREDNLAAD